MIVDVHVGVARSAVLLSEPPGLQGHGACDQRRQRSLVVDREHGKLASVGDERALRIGEVRAILARVDPEPLAATADEGDLAPVLLYPPEAVGARLDIRL